MLKKFLVLVAFVTTTSYASPKYITTGVDVLKFLPEVSEKSIYDDIAIIKYEAELIPELHIAAHRLNRCGGFMEHHTKEDALETINDINKKVANTFEYKITDNPLIDRLVKEVKEENIRETILKLSSFKNRFYKTKSGTDAVLALKELWTKNAGERSDVTVKLFKHAAWSQPSLIGTIKGESDEVVIIGGHLDSINGWFGGDNRAPGADDNASGTATVTEIFRVIAQSGYKPYRTLVFMGYAAEEVGLKGSNEIAAKYRKDEVKVAGVMQLDMTNYKGSDKDIYLTTDYTNKELNSFVEKLIKRYVKVEYGFDKCGYACSDHASWHKNGFAATFPFEAAKGNMNSSIHTEKDTIERSNGDAKHAVNFGKLGVAFAVELTTK